MLESWTTISVLAGVTSKIKLGYDDDTRYISIPSILAKIGATLDVLRYHIVMNLARKGDHPEREV